MGTNDALEVEAMPVEPPQVLGAADRWLADTGAEVARLVASGDFEPFEIASEEGYRQTKRNRQALRRHIQSLEAERKGMTSAVEFAVRAFKVGAKDAMAPLTERDAAMKAELDRWDAEWQAERRGELQEEYADFAGELADMVGFDTFEAKYATAGKWYNRSTSDAGAVKSLRESVQDVAAHLATIDSLPYQAERAAAVRAKFCVSLDLTGSIEAERREHEAAEAARAHDAAAAERAVTVVSDVETPEIGTEAARPDNYTPEDETEPHTAPQPVEVLRHIEFRCCVTDSQLAHLREYMRGAGIAAQFRKVKE